MNFGRLLRTVPQELRSLYRKLETTSKKLIRANWSITFNSVCLKENILPKYTRIRYHDPAAAHTPDTIKYRRYLIERELHLKKKDVVNLDRQREKLEYNIGNFQCDENLKNPIKIELKCILENSDRVQKTITCKKLNNLYNGQITLKSEINNFVNLSDHSLTSNEKKFLNLGLNYHIQPKYDKLHKETEIEVLYNTLTELEIKNRIIIDTSMASKLAAESTKHRNPPYKSSIPMELRKAAQNLKANENLIIRKGDKSSIYVLLNKSDYLNKINNILADSSKFKRIRKDPTNLVKQKANDLISTLNAAQDGIHMPKIVGDYSPGYIYGNVKTHKPGNPLRPIISQVLSPTYELAKILNKIITPFIPNQYLLKSTNDFIDLLTESKPRGMLASLDVESLFTNVPINTTIDIILEYAYNHSTLPPPKMPQEILKQMLELCTREAPFNSPDGGIYLQTEGVAMGSPLGPTFANFYMGHIETKIFENTYQKPSIYARYVDDIFIQVDNEEEVKALKDLFQHNSVLNFTYELSVNNKIPFLDVLVKTDSNGFHTTVYHKPTNHGTCLNADSECADKYKESVILNYLNRAYKITKNWKDFHDEVAHIKQVLVNNNFSNTTIDRLTQKFLNNKVSVPKTNKDNKTVIPIYYHNQMHGNYKLDERVIRDIIRENTYCKDANQELKLIVYYTNKKTFNLVMKNNLMSKHSTLQQTNVIYQFSCPHPHSKAEKYIGMTQTTLSRRLTMHAQAGSILQHFINEHQTKPSRNILTENTTIIAKARNRYKLAIKEALLILSNAPSINRQEDNFLNILKLRARQNRSHSTSNRSTTYLPENVDNPLSPIPHLPSSILPSSTNLPISDINLTPSLLETYQSTSSPLSLAPPTRFLTNQPNRSLVPFSPPPNLSLNLSRNNLNSPNTTSTLSMPSSPIPSNMDHSVNFITSTQLLEQTHPFTTEVSPITLIESTTHTTQITKVLPQISSQDSNKFEDSIPDMNDVLLHFGINPENMNVVPINRYQPFICLPSTLTNIQNTNNFVDKQDTLTISQRLRSMVREARYTGQYN